MQTYENPLITRYASKQMGQLFSAYNRALTFRKLWLALAKAEKQLGLEITDEQIKDLEANLTNIDFAIIEQRENEVKHDVMAHIHAYGEVAKLAKAIIHLGATSCYVTDNADLVIYKDALQNIKQLVVYLLKVMGEFANKYKSQPILGYTHYQAAQLTTVGKRMTLYMQEMISNLNEIDFALSNIKFLGCRGATGTEASFMELFNGDERKIDLMNKTIANEFGFEELFDVSGQTYPRNVDVRILNVLSSIAQTSFRFATDIRLLEHDHFIEEAFGEKQVGSSAMAYKRNPIYSERVCSLSRYLIVNALNGALTYSGQWFERTLDDSAIRRISLPEAFLGADAVLRLLIKVVSSLQVNKAIIDKAVKNYLPFIATENIMMAAVKKGGDRQQLHEIIRQCSFKASENIQKGKKGDLINILLSHPQLKLDKKELSIILNPNKYVGRAVSQTKNFLRKYRRLYHNATPVMVDINN